MWFANSTENIEFYEHAYQADVFSVNHQLLDITFSSFIPVYELSVMYVEERAQGPWLDLFIPLAVPYWQIFENR